MAIIVDNETKLVVSGLTGREGSFHGLRNRDYGTDLVAGVTPGKGGQDVEGVPIFNEIAEAVSELGANTSMIFVPARFAGAAINEAIDAGCRDGDRDHRGNPGPRHARHLLEGEGAGRPSDRPQLPGRALARARPTSASSPPSSSTPGTIGVVSKSGTLTYQIGNELKQAGLGNSSIVGIGGDPIVGIDFIDILEALRGRPRDRADRDGRRDRRRRRGARGRRTSPRT